MPILFILTNYVYIFLFILSYFYIELQNFIFYLTFFIAILNFLIGYTWLIHPKLTSLVFWSNIFNFCSLTVWCFQVYKFINYLLFFIVIFNLLSSLFIFIYLLKQENILKTEKTILIYKKIFLYSHIPILLGVFSFGLIFVNEKEKLDVSSNEWMNFLTELNPNLKETELEVIITKDFGLVRKIEIISPEDQNILLQLSLEKNLCVRNPSFCKSLNYVRFYY